MKIIKKLLIVIVLLGIIMAFYSMNMIEANATFQSDATGFINEGRSKAGGFNIGDITKEFSELGHMLSYIGAGIMVAVTSYLGVQYMMSPPDKQAVLKEKLIGVVAAGIVIFGAYEIWSIAVRMLDNL